MSVADGGPAAKAGLRRGDVISDVRDGEVDGLADFYRKVWTQRPGRRRGAAAHRPRRPRELGPHQIRRPQQLPQEAPASVARRPLGPAITRTQPASRAGAAIQPGRWACSLSIRAGMASAATGRLRR